MHECAALLSPSVEKDTERMSRRTAPGEGERYATRGYVGQYRTSAALILQYLRAGTLAWIRVADPQAGRVDDLQIGTESRVDSYQVKWSEDAHPLTFRKLTRGEADGTPSLIGQLADGWQRVCNAHVGARVVVHLVTNDIASTSDHIPGSQGGSFAAFLREAWYPARETARGSAPSIPDRWHAAWDCVYVASGLSLDDFHAFIHDCDIDMGFAIQELQTPPSAEREFAAADLDHFRHALQDAVADPRNVVELTTKQLLARLGWGDRMEFRTRHEFPVDEVLYAPIEETQRYLDTAIRDQTQGYIAVLGSPGSGKSTLLTQVLRLRARRA